MFGTYSISGAPLRLAMTCPQRKREQESREEWEREGLDREDGWHAHHRKEGTHHAVQRPKHGPLPILQPPEAIVHGHGNSSAAATGRGQRQQGSVGGGSGGRKGERQLGEHIRQAVGAASNRKLVRTFRIFLILKQFHRWHVACQRACKGQACDTH